MSFPDFDILYRDEHLVAVGKPSGVPVHPGVPGSGPAILGKVRDRVGQHVFPVHRLDRATSGVLVFGLDGAIAGILNGMLAEGRAEKRYLALTRGVPPLEGIVDNPIPRSEDGPRVPAKTSFSRRWVHGRYSLVEARPRSGRRHQVRRHLKHIGHPLIGDVRYGKGPHNRFFRAQYGLQRLALHALELAFEHPRTGVVLRLTAPVPEDLLVPLLRLGIPYPRLRA